MSKTIAASLAHFSRFSMSFLSKRAKLQTLAQLRQRLDAPYHMRVNDVEIQAITPSKWSVVACEEFASSEPETFAWIDAMPENSILWDIGANVGLFSLYAARKGLSVLAFEPVAANYASMATNIRINGLSEKIHLYNIAFTEITTLDQMHMTSTDDGTALHAFGKAENQFGRFNAVATQSIIGMAIDDFVSMLNPPLPTHIKLDVDSIELAILRGGPKVLSQVQSLLVEIEGNNANDNAIESLLAQHGLQPDARFEKPGARNQIFSRF